jgi:hypothetical protein
MWWACRVRLGEWRIKAFVAYPGDSGCTRVTVAAAAVVAVDDWESGE